MARLCRSNRSTSSRVCLRGLRGSLRSPSWCRVVQACFILSVTLRQARRRTGPAVAPNRIHNVRSQTVETAPSQSKSIIIEVRNLEAVLSDAIQIVAGVRTASSRCDISSGERKSIEESFRAVSLALAVMIAASMGASWWLLVRSQVLPPIAILAGFLGSSTAALRSCLARHAQGIEDEA